MNGVLKWVGVGGGRVARMIHDNWADQAVAGCRQFDDGSRWTVVQMP